MYYRFVLMTKLFLTLCCYRFSNLFVSVPPVHFYDVPGEFNICPSIIMYFNFFFLHLFLSYTVGDLLYLFFSSHFYRFLSFINVDSLPLTLGFPYSLTTRKKIYCRILPNTNKFRYM